MKPAFFLKYNLALGQKTEADTAAYGRGFNYQVEAGFAGEESAEHDRVASDVLSLIDHKLLGIDFDLGVEPTTVNLCWWIFTHLKKRCPELAEVRLLRGDGLLAIYRNPESAD